MVKASVSEAEDPGFESCLRRDFFGSNHTLDFKTGTLVATLPGAWHYRVSAGTSWPGVSILWLGEEHIHTSARILKPRGPGFQSPPAGDSVTVG